MRIGTENGKGTNATCPICGMVFRRKKKGQIYCGRPCAASGRRAWNDAQDFAKKEEKPKKYCAWCKQEFRPRYAQSRFCSDECKQQYRNEQAQKKLEETLKQSVVCSVCGRHFIRTKQAQRICSEECRKNAAGEVLVRIKKPGSGLNPEMQPEVGRTYKAKRIAKVNDTGVVYLVPGFGKYGVLIREEEAEVVTV